MSREQEQSSDLPQERKVTCKVCKEKIFEGAINCIHCGSFQDWRRHLSISNASFALLMATFSSISVIISSISSVATPRSHTIYTTFNNIGGGVNGEKEKTLAFFIWNEGKEPGAINDVLLKYKLKNNNTVKEVGLYSTKKPDLLKHGDHDEIFLKVLPTHVSALDFNLISEQEQDLICTVEMSSLGIKEIKKDLPSENIKSHDCIEFLESYK